MGGVDVGKTHHWVCAVDEGGKVLLSRKFANEEADILAAIATACALADEPVWGRWTSSVRRQRCCWRCWLRQAWTVRYASGRVVAAMSAAYASEGKTDAKDAYVIAETARLRRDLAAIGADTDLVRNLAVLTAYGADLIADRV
jgi:Transposase